MVRPPRNLLLARMQPDDLDRLAPALELVRLQTRAVTVSPGEPIAHVHFLEEGLGSTVVPGDPVEIGMMGREGLTGLSVLLGVDRSPHETFMQVGGEALRIEAGRLGAAMGESPSLREHLLAYAHAFQVQTAQTVHANSRFKLETRLARWLLMSHDRMPGNEIPLTHEFLAIMLGVRRAGVTVALHTLEGERLIRARRGSVTVTDRAGLEGMAGAAYGTAEAEYERLFGPLRRGRAEA
jgi:CRP-like cAMP-binding protein